MVTTADPQSGAPGFRYKAKVDAVSPAAHRKTFERHEECFLGVSLDNDMFTSPKIDAIVEWVSRRFARCVVLVGDSIHRLTLQSTGDYGPSQARDHALALGADFVETTRPVFDGFAESTKFEFLTCGEVASTAEYHGYLAALNDGFENSPTFRGSVEGFAHRYHSKRADTTTGEFAERTRTSCRYFLEEFAVFCCLQERGLSVMVYPGSFSTLTEIAAGDHPEAPSQLRGLTVVSLHLKKRKAQ